MTFAHDPTGRNKSTSRGTALPLPRNRARRLTPGNFGRPDQLTTAGRESPAVAAQAAPRESRETTRPKLKSFPGVVWPPILQLKHRLEMERIHRPHLTEAQRYPLAVEILNSHREYALETGAVSAKPSRAQLQPAADSVQQRQKVTCSVKDARAIVRANHPDATALQMKALVQAIRFSGLVALS